MKNESTTPAPIRIGSRGSRLALWQARHIAEQLGARGHVVEIEIIRTTGDNMQQPGFVAPTGVDGKGIFIKEIEEALSAKRIDLAVHSLKDLPAELDARFVLGAIPPRADARDVWVCEPYWSINTFPAGGRIGTSSPRRRAQLLALRPDVSFVEIRGNIDTRLRKLGEGQCDALVLAAAGLDRLERTEHVHYRFSADELCPAPGQGALAIEIRNPQADTDNSVALTMRDQRLLEELRFLDDADTRFCVEAERTALNLLGGGCSLPIGVYCQPGHGVWSILGQVVAPDGESMIQCQMEGSRQTSAGVLGGRLADELLAKGALRLLP